MDLALTPAQADLAAAARAAFAAGQPAPIVEGPLTDLVLVARELGRAAVPSTFHTEVLAHLLDYHAPSQPAVALTLRPTPSEPPSPGDPADLPPAADPALPCGTSDSADRPPGTAPAAPGDAGGSAGTPGWIAAGGPASPEALVAADGGPPPDQVSGVAEFVAHAVGAERVLVVVGAGWVAEVDARGDGVEIVPQATIDGEGRGRVVLDRAPVLAGWSCDVAGAVSRAAVVLAADAVGAAEAALDAAVTHVRQRTQWGAPLGTLQAVQHRAADMLIDVTLASDAVLDAAGIADRADRADRTEATDVTLAADAVLDAAGIADRADSTDSTEATDVTLAADAVLDAAGIADRAGSTEAEVRLAAAYAKATALERCRRVTAAAHQLAGGQGILADRPFHRWYRRVKAAEPALGDARRHRATIAAALLDPGGGTGGRGGQGIRATPA